MFAVPLLWGHGKDFGQFNEIMDFPQPLCMWPETCSLSTARRPEGAKSADFKNLWLCAELIFQKRVVFGQKHVLYVIVYPPATSKRRAVEKLLRDENYTFSGTPESLSDSSDILPAGSHAAKQRQDSRKPCGKAPQQESEESTWRFGNGRVVEKPNQGMRGARAMCGRGMPTPVGRHGGQGTSRRIRRRARRGEAAADPASAPPLRADAARARPRDSDPGDRRSCLVACAKEPRTDCEGLDTPKLELMPSVDWFKAKWRP